MNNNDFKPLNQNMMEQQNKIQKTLQELIQELILTKNKMTPLDWYTHAINEWTEITAAQCGLDKEDDIYQEAKKMEKEQIIDAHNAGHNYYEEEGTTAEQYYEEKYKSE